MALLHIVNKSPFSSDALASCLRLVKRDCGILLIEDGVYASHAPHPSLEALQRAMADIAVYALSPDRLARGLTDDTLIDGIVQVDYPGFVTLVEEYDRTMSWY